MENFNKFNADLEKERKLSAEHSKEAEERYPTVESIVDDYRKGRIMLGEVHLRFPDQADRDEVIRLALERNQSEK